MQKSVTRMGSLFGASGAAITSTAASICCIGPLGIAFLGVNGAILAASLKPYRFYFLGVSLLMLGWAHWTIRRKASRGAEGRACSIRTGRITKIILWTATAMWVAAVAIQFAADRYWL